MEWVSVAHSALASVPTTALEWAVETHQELASFLVLASAAAKAEESVATKESVSAHAKEPASAERSVPESLALEWVPPLALPLVLVLVAPVLAPHSVVASEEPALAPQLAAQALAGTTEWASVANSVLEWASTTAPVSVAGSLLEPVSIQEPELAGTTELVSAPTKALVLAPKTD